MSACKASMQLSHRLSFTYLIGYDTVKNSPIARYECVCRHYSEVNSRYVGGHPSATAMPATYTSQLTPLSAGVMIHQAIADSASDNSSGMLTSYNTPATHQIFTVMIMNVMLPQRPGTTWATRKHWFPVGATPSDQTSCHMFVRFIGNNGVLERC